MKRNKIPLISLFLLPMFFGQGSAASYSWAVFSEVQGGEHWVQVRKGDSLYSLAGRFGSRWEHLARINQLIPPYPLSVGQRLAANNRHIIPSNALRDGLLLNLPGHMLYLFQSGILIRRYPVGIGKTDWPTPSGTFSIVNKVRNPIWTVPKSIQEEMRQEGKVVLEKVQPGPDNPLGKYWFPLSAPGYGIHATIWPESIGHSTSHGCIRMRLEDIEDLYERLRVGTPIYIVYEPVKLAVTFDQRIYLEVHPNTYQKNISYWDRIQKLAASSQLASRIDWFKALEVLQERIGIAEEITQK